MGSIVIKKSDLQSLSEVLKAYLELVETDELIDAIFVKADEEATWSLIKKFEKALIKCKMEPQNIEEILMLLYKDTTDYIVSNKKFREFFNFFYYIRCKLASGDGRNLKAVSAYFILIGQQISLFHSERQIVVGIDTSGELIYGRNPYPGLKSLLVELNIVMNSKDSKKMDAQGVLKMYKKYGYNVKNPREIKELCNNMTYFLTEIESMIPLIDENFIDMLPIPAFEPFSEPFTLVREWFSTERYKEYLKSRRYMLPSSGVTCRFKNAGSIEEILFKEKLYNDKIIMMYRVKMNGGRYINGFYDTEEEFFSSLWSGDMKLSDTKNRVGLENFVLEVYAHLTTDMEVTRKKNTGLLIVNNIENPGFYYEDQPVMQVYRESIKVSGQNRKERLYIPFKKEDYIEVNKFIQPYIRKLPAGASASEEAKSLARSLGYELKPGETFVRAFTKSINIKNNN